VKRVVCLGDSLTSGHGIGEAAAYPAVLQLRIDKAGRDYTVVNAGVSRATSADALRRLDIVLHPSAAILILAVGANDGLRGVPVSQLIANLSRMIEIAQARSAAVLLCGMEALPIHGWKYSVDFHNAYRDLAVRYRVPLVPFILTNVIGNAALMQPDRAHPNSAGARAIADHIWPYLQPMLGAHAVR